MQYLEEKRPGYAFEGSRDIQLEQHAQRLEVVQEASRLLHQKIVVMDGTSRDERTLVSRDHGSQPWRKAEGDQLQGELGEYVYETDRSIVEERLHVCMFGKQRKEGLIELLKASAVHGVELLERLVEVMLDRVPTCN